MPVTSLKFDTRPLRVGDYYVHRATHNLVEIMEVDLSGNCKVLPVTSPLDAAWQTITASQISSCMWDYVEPAARAA
jgi:hypothetical protein